ncbi:MAG: undecaprenyl-diphosphate phosphatase [Pseudobdellovibrionaceae bacterium]
MSIITYIHAVLLGIVEGLTEFLPVSSTGHLILTKDALGFDLPSANMFVVVIQLGAILAVCWLYRIKLFDVALHLHKRPQQIFAAKVTAAFIPAAVIGLLFHKMIEEYLFAPMVVAVAMVVGGVVIWVVEKKKMEPRTMSIDEMTLRQAFLVGCAQTFALIPGTSRSGATIIGGLLLGLDRKVATEFSFFLAIPVMFGATLLDIIKYRDVLTGGEIGVMATGFIVSFFAALAAVKLFVTYIGKHDFMPFAWYRIIFGVAMIAYLML